jgi:hypothetical protein
MEQLPNVSSGDEFPDIKINNVVSADGRMRPSTIPAKLIVGNDSQAAFYVCLINVYVYCYICR